MKVVQLVMARQYRGAEIFAWQLSKRLTGKGVEVLYVSLFQTTSKAFIPDGIKWIDLGGEKRKGINLSLMTSLQQLLSDYQPDIVQANAGETLKYAVLLKKLYWLKYEIVFRNASTVSLYIKNPWQKLFYKFLYADVRLIVSVSQLSLDDFVKTFPSVKDRIMMIPNGIDTAPIQTIKEFDKSVTNLIHVGGFTFEKNHIGLLRIYKQIKSAIPNARLWLIGEGPLRSVMEDQVIRENLKDVEWVGSVANPLDYIASASALLLPSIIEGLPGVILEAMYCRTPVVAYDVGGISEVIKNGETGWLVKANDEELFGKSALQVLYADAVELDRIKFNAFDLVMREFDNGAVAGRFLEAYRHLIR
jgi:glycosyltransferase involved in cell wall biosynthesis